MRDPPGMREAYEHCRRLHRRHDPTYYWATRRLPRRRAAGGARALRLRARGRTRSSTAPAAPPTRPCAAPSWTATSSGCTRRSPASRRATRDHRARRRRRRHDLPLERLDSYFDSMRIDCAPVRMGRGRSSRATCRAAPARSGASSPCCSARRPTGTTRSPASRSRSSSPTSSATCARTGSSTASTCPGGLGRADRPRQPSDGFRRLLEVEVARARELFREGAAAGDVSRRACGAG